MPGRNQQRMPDVGDTATFTLSSYKGRLQWAARLRRVNYVFTVIGGQDDAQPGDTWKCNVVRLAGHSGKCWFYEMRLIERTRSADDGRLLNLKKLLGYYSVGSMLKDLGIERPEAVALAKEEGMPTVCPGGYW